MNLIIVGGDIETTGLDQEKGAQIIEVGLTLYSTKDGRSFKRHGNFLKRCKPTVPIEASAQLVHGITLDDLKHEPSWNDIAPQVSKILDRADLFVAHNVEFDAPFLALELVRAGLPIPSFNTFCTMENGRSATALGKLPNLGELCWAFDVDYDADAAHAADYDIEKTMDCFFKGVWRGYFQVPEINKLLEKESA